VRDEDGIGEGGDEFIADDGVGGCSPVGRRHAKQFDDQQLGAAVLLLKGESDQSNRRTDCISTPFQV